MEEASARLESLRRGVDKLTFMPKAKAIYGFELSYNGSEILRVMSEERAGLSIHLYNTKSALVCLRISVKKKGSIKNRWLRTILPGDHLHFRYIQNESNLPQNLVRLSKFKRNIKSHGLKPRHRLGIDFKLKTGETWRTSHPKNGGFNFFLGNVPMSHARAFLMAGNEEEKWHYQLSDLYPNDDIELKIVETNWCDEARTINR